MLGDSSQSSAVTTSRNVGRVRGADHRIAWIESALEPVRDRLTRSDYDDLVSSLVLVIAGETFIVLLDVRGLSVNRARR